MQIRVAFFKRYSKMCEALDSETEKLHSPKDFMPTFLSFKEDWLDSIISQMFLTKNYVAMNDNIMPE